MPHSSGSPGRKACAFTTSRHGQAQKPESTEDNPLPRPEALEKAKQSAGAIIDLPDAVTAVVLRLDPPPHGPPQESPVGNIVVAHAKKRAERAAEVEKAKDDGQEVENQIVEILKKMRGPDGRAVVSNRDLEGKLEEYKDKVHDPDLIASARAEADWPAREHDFPQAALDRQYEEIDQWSPEAAGKKPLSRAMFDSHAASYRDYLKEHESAKGAFAVKLTRLAKERLELARGGAKLIDLLNASVKPAAGAGPAKARIEAIAALVKLNDEDPPDRLRTSLRRVARLLCDDFVKKEPFDDFVQVLNDKTYDTVKRKDVSIHPKNGDDELLGPDGEYSLKADQIDLLTVKDDTLGPFPSGSSPLKGTRYSDAIKAFNDERTNIKQWSVEELGKLLDICVQHKSDLETGGAPIRVAGP